MQRIQEGSTGTLLRERFRLSGIVSPQLDETVVPTISVGSLDVGGLPAVRRVAMVQGIRTAAAGLNPVIRFRVPPSILALITRVRLAASAAQLIEVHFGDSGLAGPFAASATLPEFADARVRIDQGETPACFFDTGDNAGLIVAPIVLPASLSPAINTFEVDWPVGGSAQADLIEFVGFTVASQIRVELEWIEYVPV